MTWPRNAMKQHLNWIPLWPLPKKIWTNCIWLCQNHQNINSILHMNIHTHTYNWLLKIDLLSHSSPLMCITFYMNALSSLAGSLGHRILYMWYKVIAIFPSSKKTAIGTAPQAKTLIYYILPAIFSNTVPGRYTCSHLHGQKLHQKMQLMENTLAKETTLESCQTVC